MCKVPLGFNGHVNRGKATLALRVFRLFSYKTFKYDGRRALGLGKLHAAVALGLYEAEMVSSVKSCFFIVWVYSQFEGKLKSSSPGDASPVISGASHR